MTPLKRTRPAKCPVCAKPARADHAPFCSARCARVDLGRWLGGHYAIPPQGPAEFEDSVPRADNDADNDNDNDNDNDAAAEPD